jgi:hypothetical protein
VKDAFIEALPATQYLLVITAASRPWTRLRRSKGSDSDDHDPRPILKGGAALVETHGKTTNVEVPT